MDKLRIYVDNNGQNIDFYTGIDIANYTYNAQRMGDIKISCEFQHKDILDNRWTGREFVIYKNEKYFIVTKPNCSKTNTEVPYKYTFDALHEQECLKGIYFMDIVTDSGTVSEYKYFTNKPTVLFQGTIQEYVARLDKNLKTYLSGWSAVLIDGTTSEYKLFSITNAYIFDSLKTANETFGTSWYIREKVIYFGNAYNIILDEFEYGMGRGLYTISKTPSTEKPITSITGVGASENIPYYYPNASEVHGADWIVPQDRLMPPLYRESYGVQRFYNAIGGQYENQYNANFPNQYILETDIKPSIENVYFGGQRIDSIVAVTMDANDNDEIENDTTSSNFGNYKHPNFKITIPPLGFSLFDSLADKDSASIKMQTGRCAACNFKILFDETKLLTGNVPDTTNTPTQLVVQKDQDTFGTLLPNGAISVIAGDIYAFLGINLPISYITAAENKLKAECLRYMLDNNTSKFTFDCSFDEKYLTVKNIEVTLNSKIKIKFDNRVYENYVDTLNIKYNLEQSIFPAYTVTLKEYVKPRLSKTLVTSANITNALTTEFYKQTTQRSLVIPNGAIGLNQIRQRDRTAMEKTAVQAEKSISVDLIGVENGICGLDEKGVVGITNLDLELIASEIAAPRYEIYYNPDITGGAYEWLIEHTCNTEKPNVQVYDAETGIIITEFSEVLQINPIQHIEGEKQVKVIFSSGSLIKENSYYAILIG